MWSQFTNVTDGRTDRQTTCDRNTALCTKVHRAVKMAYGESIRGRCSDVAWPGLKGQAQAHDPIRLGSSQKQLEMLFSTNRLLLDSMLWGSKVGYPSDSLASCLIRVMPRQSVRSQNSELLITDRYRYLFILMTFFNQEVNCVGKSEKWRVIAKMKPLFSNVS